MILPFFKIMCNLKSIGDMREDQLSMELNYNYKSIKYKLSYQKLTLELECEAGKGIKIDIWGHQNCSSCNIANREFSEASGRNMCKTCYGTVSENATYCNEGKLDFNSVTTVMTWNKYQISYGHWLGKT